MTRSERIGDYLDQMDRVQDKFFEEHSQDSSTWNLADARTVANFYMYHLAEALSILGRAQVDMRQLEDELKNVLDVVERWSQESPFREQA